MIKSRVDQENTFPSSKGRGSKPHRFTINDFLITVGYNMPNPTCVVWVQMFCDE